MRAHIDDPVRPVRQEEEDESVQGGQEGVAAAWTPPQRSSLEYGVS